MKKTADTSSERYANQTRRVSISKSCLNYRKSIDGIISSGKTDNLDSVIANHLVKISFFQHERLIHLIVTVLFALLDMAAFILAVFSFSLTSAWLCVVITGLLCAYIKHYYFLENEVQKMYVQYDKLILINCK